MEQCYEFTSWIGMNPENRVKKIYNDNAAEFMALKRSTERRVTYTTPWAYNLQEIGLAERINRAYHIRYE